MAAATKQALLPEHCNYSLLCFPCIPLSVSLHVVGWEVYLYRHRPWEERKAAEDAADRQTAGLLGIVIVLLILVCSLFLVQQLRSREHMENCQLAGRTNCEILVPLEH